MNNKRGQFLIIGTFIVALIVIALFLFSPKLRLIIGGVALVVGAVIMTLKYSKNARVKTFILLTMFIGGILLIFVFPSFTQSITGSSYLSISKVEIDGTNQIRIFAVTNGAEELLIDWTPSQINNKISDGSEVTKSVTGRIELVNPTAEFNLISDTSKPFFIFRAEQIGLLSNCGNNVPSGWIYAGSLGTTVTKRNCLYIRSIGNYGYSNGQPNYNTPVNINIGGATGVLNPSTGNNALTLNDGKTKIEWTGNLIGSQLTTSLPYGAWFQNSQYVALVDSDAYSRYQTNLNTLADGIGASSLSNNGILGTIFNIKSFTVIQSSVDNYNVRLDQILENKITTYESSINANDVFFSGNKLVIDLKSASVFPTFIITLDADKVGLRSLKGTPDIVSCPSAQELSSGQSTNPTLKVKNVGQDDGSFFGSVVCDNLGVYGTINELLVREGETINMPIQISGSAPTKDISSSCKITITDRKSFDTDTCNFNVKVTYQPNVVCDPNSIGCFGSSILRTCNADGTSFTDKVCDNGCQVKTGNDECIGTINNGGDNLQCNSLQQIVPAGTIEDCGKLGWKKLVPLVQCETKTYEASCKTADWVLYVIIGIVVLGLGLGAIYSTKPKRKGGKKR